MYPDCEDKADQREEPMDTAKGFYGPFFLVHGAAALDDGEDEGEDVDGKADPAGGDQVVGHPVLAVVAVGVPNPNHDVGDGQLDDQLQQNGGRHKRLPIPFLLFCHLKD